MKAKNTPAQRRNQLEPSQIPRSIGTGESAARQRAGIRRQTERKRGLGCPLRQSICGLLDLSPGCRDMLLLGVGLADAEA